MEWQGEVSPSLVGPTPVHSPVHVSDHFGKVVYLNDPMKRQTAPELITMPGETVDNRKRKAELISQS